MSRGHFRFFVPIIGVTLFSVQCAVVFAQDSASAVERLSLPGVSGFVSSRGDKSLTTSALSEIMLTAQLTDKGRDISRGLVWRVFLPEAGPDGKLPLVASAHGGSNLFKLPPGSYLVHAAYGLAGATKRITVDQKAKRENLVLDAGGLKLDAMLSGGVSIPSIKLKFSIFEGDSANDSERALIISNVAPNSVVRLNAGTYHIVSNYSGVDIGSDIRVEAGKLTEAMVEHRAADVTFKLVREAGGEAIADTSWSVLTESGDPLREAVGAFASMALSEGEYTIIAKNRDRIYQRDFTVVAGHNQDVEVIVSKDAVIDTTDSTD